ncbi:Ig-like domain-containing protein [Nonomuraea sp. MCN248]|uniref:Ig-like domain-containing protein n=1 Tax=Nonomuraea corallina TaxID=2989783 RepID=A0ABT4SBJ1_9ACTN|nr:Ig-like domain-containing protein [Nonomuraea corallina]MDA0634301.1 Ig-like domain-containing protein [Nonomuraea corallina]
MLRRAATVWLAALLLPAGGCGAVTARAPAPRPPLVSVSPPLGAGQARPDQGLVVRAHGGPLHRVVAHADGFPVPGDLDAARTTWRSRWALRPGAAYTVTVTAAGRTVAVGGFRTRAAERSLQVTATAPRPGETVGVGMPIILDFDLPVRDRAAVERALEVRADRPVEGAWRWIGDTRVVYRTRRFWPAWQQVTVTAHLAGVRAAPGVYGTADRTLTFSVGRDQTSRIDTRTHRMTVRRDGRTVQDMAISAGMATTREYTTTSGVHLTMDKGHPVRMISPGREKGDPGYYDVMIDHAVRISDSGEYVHAKDNVWAQGRRNVSHGCVNARPDQAAWFHAHSLRGDPVVIIGTDRDLEWDNGWGFWQMPWEKWREGSALRSPGDTPLPQA